MIQTLCNIFIGRIESFEIIKQSGAAARMRERIRELAAKMDEDDEARKQMMEAYLTDIGIDPKTGESA